MRLSIRWKLLATYLAALLVMGGTLFIYLDRTLEQQFTANLAETLFHEAGLTALLIGDNAISPERIVEIGERLDARVTVIAPDGQVLADSQVNAAGLASLDNHLSRSEVAEALRSGRGSAVRHSTTINRDMLYAAVRLGPAERPAGVLRLALSLDGIEQTRRSLHRSLIIAFCLAGALATGLSLLLIQFFTNVLQNLSEGAERFGAGDFRRRLTIPSNDEIGDLARVMNTMAERLHLQMISLEAQRNRLNTILRGMGEGLLVADRNGTVLLVNPAFSRFFGTDDSAVDQPLIHLTRHPELHETFHRVLDSRSEETNELLLPAGTTLLTHWVPLLDNGRMIGIVAVFHDISDIKRLETIRRDFVANVSHELRTPVTVIRGYAETLGSGLIVNDAATAERFARVIQSHAERLTVLISDLLTLSQLEAQGSALTLVPVDLGERLRHVCDLLQAKFEEKKIRLDVEALPARRVLADPQRLEQILFNLLDNAVKYTPANGHVRIIAAAADEFIRIRVEDSGPGVPEEARQRIFERFYRLDAGRSREAGGTGLGLAIAKHLVTLHGGQIGVEPAPGGGSSFWFTLRIAG